MLAAHQDTDNYHAHVIANRVGPDGKANDLWQKRIKRERTCAEIAAERGWEIVVGRHNRDSVQRVRHLNAPPPDPERQLSDRAYRRLRERGELLASQWRHVDLDRCALFVAASLEHSRATSGRIRGSKDQNRRRRGASFRWRRNASCFCVPIRRSKKKNEA